MTDAREEGRTALADGIRAGIYCRMSIAAVGDTTKVDDQERICRDLAGRLGWDVADVYQDNNRSAWQKSRKRPGWDRMLADVEAARITGIIVYHGDRLIRQPFDLEKLINLADGKGIRLAAPTGIRDFGSSDDRYIMRIEAAGQCRESDRTSQRRKDQYERWRREGRVRSGGRGGRAFGFATDGLTHVPAECDIIREAAGRLLAGESVSGVARSLADRGTVTPAGNPVTLKFIREMLSRPRYAGLMPDGVSTAAWEPVLERETWESVIAVLARRGAPYPYVSNARKYLLSGIARCGMPGCGRPLQVGHAGSRTTEGQRGYKCTADGCRKVFRNVRRLDLYVIAAVVARLNLDANPHGQVPEVPGLAAEFRALAGQRAEIEAALSDHTQGRLSLLLARLDSLDARLAQLRELAGDSARARLRRQHAGITEEEFRALPLGVQRSIVAACVEVTVRPASRRGPGFRTEDVDVIALQA